MDAKTINNNPLNVLGFYPESLNILIELAENAKGIKSFNVIKNIPVENTEFYIPHPDYSVTMFDWFENKDELNSDFFYALGVLGTTSKKTVYKTFKNHVKMDDEQFINLIHSSSQISKSANLSNGIQIESLCSISVNTSIGFGVNIKRNCNIGHHCKIGDFVTINPGVTVCGFVNIGPNTLIGAGTMIKDGVSIGENTIIGMGSNVVKDIPSNCVAYGNPCIVHKTKEKKE